MGRRPYGISEEDAEAGIKYARGESAPCGAELSLNDRIMVELGCRRMLAFLGSACHGGHRPGQSIGSVG